MSKRITQVTSHAIMSEHGEVIQGEQSVTYRIGEEPPFIKLYLDAVLYLKDMPKGYSGVLMELLKRMTYAGEPEGQIVYVNSHMKKTIATTLGFSVSRVNNVLTDLVAGGLLDRVGTGTYQVNPVFFGRGEWRNIEKMRLSITFDSRGKTFLGEIERKKNKAQTQIEGQEQLSLMGEVEDENYQADS